VVYVIVSGVSPFLDDSLDETCSNIVRRDFCFPHEYFSGISGDAKDFISMLLVFDIGSVSSCRLFFILHDTHTLIFYVDELFAFLRCHVVPFTRSFFCSSGQILLPRYLMNGLNNFDKTDMEYSLAPTMT